MKWAIAIVGLAGDIVYVAWILSSIALSGAKVVGHEPRDMFRTIYHELKPFYWAAVLALNMDDVTKHGIIVYLLNWTHYLSWAGFIYIWVAFRNLDDDDRWKRRRKKLAEAVKRVGDRLVVTFPEPVVAR